MLVLVVPAGAHGQVTLAISLTSVHSESRYLPVFFQTRWHARPSLWSLDDQRFRPSPPRSITVLSTMCIPLLPSPFYWSLSFPPLPSYHSDSEVEHEKVADKSATNSTAVHVVCDTLTPTPDTTPVPDVEYKVPAAKAVQETMVPAAVIEGGRRPGSPCRGREGGRVVRLHHFFIAGQHTDNLTQIQMMSESGLSKDASAPAAAPEVRCAS